MDVTSFTREYRLLKVFPLNLEQNEKWQNLNNWADLCTSTGETDWHSVRFTDTTEAGEDSE